MFMILDRIYICAITQVQTDWGGQNVIPNSPHNAVWHVSFLSYPHAQGTAQPLSA